MPFWIARRSASRSNKLWMYSSTVAKQPRRLGAALQKAVAKTICHAPQATLSGTPLLLALGQQSLFEASHEVLGER